jgi:hypothetical protein
MSTLERKKTGRPPISDDASMMTLRLDRKLQAAFGKVVSEQGHTSSETIRGFMLRTVQAAGRSDLLKN